MRPQDLPQPTVGNVLTTTGIEQVDDIEHSNYPQINSRLMPGVQQVLEQQKEILKMVASSIGASVSKGFGMPKRNFLTFDGNPLAYPSFIENFQTNVEDMEGNPNARHNYLIQLCTGKTKEAISETEEGYAKAKSILKEMFGQTHIIVASHIDRVTKGGAIGEFESQKLLQLARDMVNCQMNLSKLGFHADIKAILKMFLCRVLRVVPCSCHGDMAYLLYLTLKAVFH